MPPTDKELAEVARSTTGKFEQLPEIGQMRAGWLQLAAAAANAKNLGFAKSDAIEMVRLAYEMPDAEIQPP